MSKLHMVHKLDTPPGGQGVTVRRGFKWALRTEESKYLDLCVCSHGQPGNYNCPPEDVQGKGYVIEVWVGRFRDLPARLVALEHEESSRTYEGLLGSMQRAYGSLFSEQEFVTALRYTRLTEDETVRTIQGE